MKIVQNKRFKVRYDLIINLYFISFVFSGAVAVYDFGINKAQSWSKLDIGSTGNDYSNDVIARAQRLIEHKWTCAGEKDFKGF